MQASDKKSLERGFGAVAALAATIGVLTTTLTSTSSPVTAAPTSLAAPTTVFSSEPSSVTEPSVSEPAMTAAEPAATAPSPDRSSVPETDVATPEVEPTPTTATAVTIEDATTIDALSAATDLSDDDAHVLRLYEAFYGRQPDLDGARFWLDQRRSGVEMDGIAQAFAASDEFAATYGGLDDAAFVESAYRTALGREIDPAGFAFWVVELDRGMSRESVLVFFTGSEEFADRSAQTASS